MISAHDGEVDWLIDSVLVQLVQRIVLTILVLVLLYFRGSALAVQTVSLFIRCFLSNIFKAFEIKSLSLLPFRVIGMNK